MTADAPDLGGLSLMLDGYFHEDFRAEYGGHEGTARALVRDASGEERSEWAATLDQLLAWATDVPRARWQEALGAAGGVVPGNDAITERSAPSDYYSAALRTRASLRTSRFVVDHASLVDNVLRRRTNYQRWVETVASVPNCHPLVPVLPRDCAPYMFPLHIDHPDPHFYWLKHLGVPIWRWDEMADSGCPIAREYRLHLLHLPCHQALTEDQMTWMTTAVARTLQHFAGAVP